MLAAVERWNSGDSVRWGEGWGGWVEVRARSAREAILRWAWWRAILSGASQFLRELHFSEAARSRGGR